MGVNESIKIKLFEVGVQFCSIICVCIVVVYNLSLKIVGIVFIKVKLFLKLIKIKLEKFDCYDKILYMYI